MNLSKLISFANQKGGVMKTTLTSLFANYLHLETDYSVIVIDADRQKTLTVMRQIDLSEGEDPEQLYDIVTIPAIDVPKKISNIIGEYDFIIIDLPGNLYEPGVMDCVKLIDYVFVPTNVTIQDLTSSESFIRDYFQDIAPIRQKADLPINIAGVLTKVNRAKTRYKEFRAQVNAGDYQIRYLNNKKEASWKASFLTNDIEYNETTFGDQVSTATIYKNYKGKDYSEICKELTTKILN